MAEGFPSNENLAIEEYADQAPKPFKPNASFFEKIKSPFFKIFEEKRRNTLRRDAVTTSNPLLTSTPIITTKKEHPPVTEYEDTQNKMQSIEKEQCVMKQRHNITSGARTKIPQSGPRDDINSFTSEDSYSETPKWITQAEEIIKPNNAFLTGLDNNIKHADKTIIRNKPRVENEFLPIRQPIYPIIPQKKTVRNSEFLSAMSHIATFSGDESQDAKKFVRNIEEVKEMLELGNDKV